MTSNPILDELHATREKLLAEADGDFHRYVMEARTRALASGHPLAEPTQRTNRSNGRVAGSGGFAEGPESLDPGPSRWSDPATPSRG